MTESLITRYRPDDFDQVLGQDAVVKALLDALDNKRAQTFLFTGPSGTGKTTLSRLIAKHAGCLPANLIEVDAASKTGIDDMRAVAQELMYKPLGGGVKVLLVDECHALSKQAWTSLLKSIEEPPAWVFWCLCTTDPAKVPANIVSRCMRCDLKPVSRNDLAELLLVVAEAEKIEPKDLNKIVDLCVSNADGSPRQALSNLNTCAAATTYAEAANLLRTAEENAQAIDLARLLNSGRADWGQVWDLLNQLSEVSPEAVRHVVRAYTEKVVLGAKNGAAAEQGLAILEAFSKPFHSSDGKTPLLLACGGLVLGGAE